MSFSVHPAAGAPVVSVLPRRQPSSYPHKLPLVRKTHAHLQDSSEIRKWSLTTDRDRQEMENIGLPGKADFYHRITHPVRKAGYRRRKVTYMRLMRSFLFIGGLAFLGASCSTPSRGRAREGGCPFHTG